MEVSNTEMRPRPRPLASYMAMSASRMISSAAAVAQVAERQADAGLDGELGAGATKIGATSELLHAARPGAAASSDEPTESEKHRELVAAQARHVVARPHARLKAPRHLDQQVVALAECPRAVVDHLEAVQVQQQHPEAHPLVLRALRSTAARSRSMNASRFGRPVSPS
jgi:hypothetical protein